MDDDELDEESFEPDFAAAELESPLDELDEDDESLDDDSDAAEVLLDESLEPDLEPLARLSLW